MRVALGAAAALAVGIAVGAPIDNTATGYKATTGQVGGVPGSVMLQSVDGYNAQPVNSAHPLSIIGNIVCANCAGGSSASDIASYNGLGPILTGQGTAAGNSLRVAVGWDGATVAGSAPGSFVQPVSDGGSSLTVDGLVSVIQSGAWAVSILGTVPVSGPLTDAQLRATPVPVSGTMAVSNFPTTQPVNGTVTANQGGAPWSVSQSGAWTFTANQGTSPWVTSVSNFPTTQAVSAASLPLPTNAAKETGGNLDEIALDTDNLALIKAKTDNLDVALSTRLKPSDTLTGVTTVTTITNPVGVKGGDGLTIASVANPVPVVGTGTGGGIPIVGSVNILGTTIVQGGQADKSAFVVGTTFHQPVGGIVTDVAPDTVAENTAAAARITPKRAVHTNLRNQAGTEIGTAAAPVRTDPTGTTTQPVNGTVAATQSGAWTTGRTWTLGNGTDSVTAQQGSAPWSVSQSTAAAASGAWPIKVTDGTSTAAVKAASTAAVATDPALVVAVSPNSVLPVSTTPSSASSAGIVGVQTTVLATSLVLKASPGNLYDVYLSNDTAAKLYLMIFDATAAPIDGVVTPVHCVPIPAGGVGSFAVDGAPPEVFSTGIVAVSSSTGCFTKTASNASFIHGRAK